MPTVEDIEVVASRFGTWGRVLGDLSDPVACGRLLAVLEEGDGEGLHDLVGEWGFPGPVQCLEIIDIVTKLAQTGDNTYEWVCSFVTRIRPASPSTSSGRGYRLRDGRILWLSDAQWWEMFDHAVDDPAWRDGNRELLIDVGILTGCTWERLVTVSRVNIEKHYIFCPPTWDPQSRSG